MQPTSSPSDGRTFDKDRPLGVRRRVVVMLAGVIVVALARILAAAPRMVDAVYSEGVGPWIGLALAKVSNLVPFSLMEVAVGVLVLRGGIAAAVSLYHVVRRRRRLGNALASGLLRTGTAAALIVAFFYAGWGFSFARPKMIARLRWQSFLTAKADGKLADELAAMCEGLVRAANDDYMRTFKSQDTGVSSYPPLSMAELDAAIEEGYRRVTAELNLKHHFAVPRGRIKPVVVSPLMSRLLILGFYSPWTGESQYNTETPGCELPHIVAHEKAHQRCITSEDEANFLGVMACVLSDVPYVRYSGYLAAQRQLLNELNDLDPDRAKEIIAKRHAGVQRDRDASKDFVMKHIGALSRAGRAMNDAYLKANRVKEGVLSYNMDTQLLIAFTRARGSAWYDSRLAGSDQQPPATANPG